MNKDQKEKRHPKAPILPLSFDPMGSYTGVPMDPLAVPVQDADDL